MQNKTKFVKAHIVIKDDIKKAYENQANTTSDSDSDFDETAKIDDQISMLYRQRNDIPDSSIQITTTDAIGIGVFMRLNQAAKKSHYQSHKYTYKMLFDFSITELINYRYFIENLRSEPNESEKLLTNGYYRHHSTMFNIYTPKCLPNTTCKYIAGGDYSNEETSNSLAIQKK